MYRNCEKLSKKVSSEAAGAADNDAMVATFKVLPPPLSQSIREHGEKEGFGTSSALGEPTKSN